MDTPREFVLDLLYSVQAILSNRTISNGNFLEAMGCIRQAIKVLEQNKVEAYKSHRMKGAPHDNPRS